MSSVSIVTYSSVYTDSEPGRVFWGADEELSDGGSPKVIVYGYDGFLMHPVMLCILWSSVPSPDTANASPPMTCLLLPTDALPTALSPCFVADSNPDEDLEEDLEEGHADYPANRGDGDDEPSNDDNDDDDTGDEDGEPFEDEDDDKEEEEHLALVDSSAAPIPSPPLPISSPPLPIPPPTIDSPTYVKASLGYRAARIRLRAPPPSTYHPLHPSSPYLPPPVPTSLPLPSLPLPPLPALLSIPPPVDRREDTPKAELPPYKRLCLTTPTSRYVVGESSTVAPRPIGGHRADYGFIETMDAEIRCQRAEEVGYGIRDVWGRLDRGC
ncbi:hypothetical protein Tco_0934668 [Tanacetum coccineum]